MKKIKTLFFLFALFINNIFSYGFDYKTKIELNPLESNEFLDWEYDTNILNIYKVSENKKELYDSIDYLYWDNWEVSKDRKKIIYWESWSNYERNELPNYYLLNGKTGKTRYLGKLPEGFTSSDFKYLIYKDSSVNPKVKFIIYNIESKKNEKEIVWNLKSEKYFSEEENTTYILRSNLPDFDFHIFIVGMGRYVFAEGYLNIEQNKITTIADDEDEDRKLDLDSFSKYELGK